MLREIGVAGGITWAWGIPCFVRHYMLSITCPAGRTLIIGLNAFVSRSFFYTCFSVSPSPCLSVFLCGCWSEWPLSLSLFVCLYFFFFFCFCSSVCGSSDQEGFYYNLCLSACLPVSLLVRMAFVFISLCLLLYFLFVCPSSCLSACGSTDQEDLSQSLPVCLSSCVSVGQNGLCLYLFVCHYCLLLLFVCPSSCLSACVSADQEDFYLHLCLSACVSASLSDRPSVCLYVCLSLFVFSI